MQYVCVFFWQKYKASKKRLQNTIKKTNSDSWKLIWDKIETDIWGDGYKIAMKRTIWLPSCVDGGGDNGEDFWKTEK